MGRYLINDEILFGIEVGVARNLYNRERRRERKEFKRAMRKAAKWGSKPKAYKGPRAFKKCGRARP